MFGHFGLKKMSLNRSIGSAEFLKKKVPKNAKYDYVKTRLDTGFSRTKYEERLEEIKRNYRYRNNEIFKRLKVTTFAQLILQVASVSDMHESETDVESHGREDGLSVGSSGDLECAPELGNGCRDASPLSDQEDSGENKSCHTARSTLLSVISGVGELNMQRNGEKKRGDVVSCLEPSDRPYPDCPYLLLDVRDREEYDHCHLIGAHSFPIALLSRTMNPYTKDVLKYKNAAGKIIIVYDEDERTASQAATTMCERGFENLFMLCGGLKVIAQKFPSGMTTGSLPTSCLSSPTSSKPKKRPAPQQPPPQAAEKRWRFTSDELLHIQEQLNEVFIPSNSSSRLSSRLSTSSAQSNSSSRLGSSTAGSARVQSSRPWK